MTCPVPGCAHEMPCPFHRDTAGEDGKRDGMQSAWDHANEEWKAAAIARVISFARGTEFIVDHVWRHLDSLDVKRPHERKALGPVLLWCARQDMIRTTGRFVKSTLGVNHSRKVEIWERL